MTEKSSSTEVVNDHTILSSSEATELRAHSGEDEVEITYPSGLLLVVILVALALSMFLV
jgi:hypothetical protein